MKDSGVKWLYEIPQEWTVCRVKNVFTNKKRIVNEKCVDYERLALTLNGVIKRDKSDKDGLQPEKFEGYQILEKNELVFKLIDLQNISTSRVGLSPYTGIVSPAYIVLSNEQVDNRFAYYYFYSMYLRCIFNQLGSDMVRSCLNAKDLLELPYLMFDLKEQQRIADYLDRECEKIDNLIAHEQTTIERLKEFKQSVISEAVTKGLDKTASMKDSGIEWIGEVPIGWVCLRLKSLLIDRNGGAWGEEEKHNEGDVICIRVADFNFDTQSLKNCERTVRNYQSNIIDKLKLQSNDILIEKSGGGEKTPVGRTILTNECENCLYSNFIDRLRIKENFYPKFIAYLFRTMYYNNVILSYIKQTTGIQNLDCDKFLNEFVYLPLKDKQYSIVEYLDHECVKIEELISVKKEKIEKLIEHKKSLIYEYVTGKKEVV